MRTNLEVLRRRWWIIAATTLVALATSWALTSRAERVYQGTVTLRVSTPTSSGATVRGDDVTYTDRLVNTYTQILNSRPLRDDVRRQAGLAERPSLGVTVPANTELMRITATERDGRAAAAAANASFDALKAKVRQLAAEDQQAATQIFGARVRELEASLIPVRKEYAAATAAAANEYSERARAAADEIRRLQETLARVRADFDAARLAAQRRADTISLIEPASVPGSPSSPNVPRNLAAGLLFGLIGGLGLAFLLDRADTRLRSSHQIAEAAVATVLGQIPGSAPRRLFGRRKVRPVLFDPVSPEREAFRRLRTNLLALERDEPLRTVLVASAEPHEGKTTTVVNLATAVAQSGRAVLVLDCDLRVPRVHQAFGIDNTIGVGDVLSGRHTLGEGIVPSGVPGVSVLPAGAVGANPTELLGSPRMSVLLEHVARNFDLVLIDSPAFLAVADSGAIAPQVDGVLVVVRRTAVRAGAVRELRRQLTIIKAPVLGVVVTGADVDANPYEQYESMVRHGG